MKRETESRSSEEEEDNMKAETFLVKERRLENVDIVRVLLVKDSDSNYRKLPVKRSDDAVSAANKFLAGEDREVFIVINLDRSLKINSIHVVAIGSMAAAIIHPREVFKTAILSNTSSIVLAHNHPSGNPAPSDEDKRITEQLFECGDLLGIKVEDHIIIGDDEYSHCERIAWNGKKGKIAWLTDKIKHDQEMI